MWLMCTDSKVLLEFVLTRGDFRLIRPAQPMTGWWPSVDCRRSVGGKRGGLTVANFGCHVTPMLDIWLTWLTWECPCWWRFRCFFLTLTLASFSDADLILLDRNRVLLPMSHRHALLLSVFGWIARWQSFSTFPGHLGNRQDMCTRCLNAVTFFVCRWHWGVLHALLGVARSSCSSQTRKKPRCFARFFKQLSLSSKPNEVVEKRRGTVWTLRFTFGFCTQ